MSDDILIGVWLLLPIPTWLATLCLPKPRRLILRLLMIGFICFASACAGYVAFVSSVMIWDARLEAEMNKHDLDGDGGISEDELTPAAQQAIDDWANDTGRAFAPIVGVPITILWYAFLFTLLFLGEWLVRWFFFQNGRSTTSQLEPSLERVKRADDGNPYQPPHVQ